MPTLDPPLTPHELAVVRVAAGLSRAEIAEQLGVSLAYVGHWETGTRPVPARQAVAIVRLARRQGVTVAREGRGGRVLALRVRRNTRR